MPGRKENNTRHFQAYEAWIKKKKEGRPKQVWMDYYILEPEELIKGYWEKVFDIESEGNRK